MTWVQLEHGLGAALRANRPGSGVAHVVVALPSLNLGPSLLVHYARRVPALEHRFLLGVPMLARVRDAELVLACSVPPPPCEVDHCFSLLPEDVRDDCRRRFRVLSADDPSSRPLAGKLLDRPDLVERLRGWIGDRPGFIEPWNVTDTEVALAEALGIPVNGTAPELWPLGFKSAGRRLLREAGVPVSDGAEDVRGVDDVLAAIEAIRSRRPDCRGVVVKTDNSGSGDGNRVIRLGAGQDAREALSRLPPWYVEDLRHGAVVEELVCGEPFSSPSVQVDLLPDGPPRVVSTHEQVLGGSEAQVYLGCRFPADEGYAADLARYGLAAGERLGRLGALGRIGIDFAAGLGPDGRLRLCALEVNLRKGGTTHPFAVLRNLVPGRYDLAGARWVADAGGHRFYEATDNLVDPAWLGRDPRDVIESVRRAGLEFDHRRGVGVVLHMLSGLEVEGRMGLTAIGASRTHAAELFAATAEVLRD